MKVKNLIEAKRVILEEKGNIAQNFGVKKIGIFGSFVFGDFTPKSDIDILVEFQKAISYFELISLEDYLSKKLGRKADVVPKKALKAYIKNDILNSTVYV